MAEYFAHESCYIDEGCTIGAGTKIWHFSHVMTGARIGRGCNIGQNVVVSPDVTVGDNVKIQNNVSLYTGVILEDNVFCGPSIVFTNVINPRSHVPRRNEYQRTLALKVSRPSSRASAPRVRGCIGRTMVSSTRLNADKMLRKRTRLSVFSWR